MDTNLEIAFHNMPSQPDLEALIRERAEKLERLYDRIIGLRVAVEHQQRQHKTGNLFDVHIEVMVPGNDLVVSRKPHKARERYANPDARTSIRDAFQAAERQLKDYKQKQRNDVKTHEAELPARVVEVDVLEGRGTIETGSGEQLDFRSTNCMNVDFADLQPGDPVKYMSSPGDTGRTAAKVWRAAGADTELSRLG